MTTRAATHAARHTPDLLWRAALIETPHLTRTDAHAILAGTPPKHARAGEVAILNNLKHAWRFLLDNTDWQYLSECNRLIGQGIEPAPGAIRSEIVAIGGTEYTPAIPTYETIREQISRDMAADTPEERALNLFASITRGQWFSNGNKRTAAMAANHSLIHDETGVFALPPERINDEFRDRLLTYYETNDRRPFLDWLHYHAIGRLDLDGLTQAQHDGIDRTDTN